MNKYHLYFSCSFYDWFSLQQESGKLLVLI
jgi:hypothetical protein